MSVALCFSNIVSKRLGFNIQPDWSPTLGKGMQLPSFSNKQIHSRSKQTDNGAWPVANQLTWIIDVLSLCK